MEVNGNSNGSQLHASDEIQSNNNNADESSEIVASSDRIPLNENTNGSQSQSQIQSNPDELIQKRKAEEDDPLKDEENSIPAKKAAMNQTEEAFNAQ